MSSKHQCAETAPSSSAVLDGVWALGFKMMAGEA
jgi:hypothetical protein